MDPLYSGAEISIPLHLRHISRRSLIIFSFGDPKNLNISTLLIFEVMIEEGEET